MQVALSLEDRVREVVDIDVLRPDWMLKAACRGQGFDAWFTIDELGEQANAARQVCAGCPVRAACLEYALGAPVRDGLWGGLSARERAAVARRRRPQRRPDGRWRSRAFGR